MREYFENNLIFSCAVTTKCHLIEFPSILGNSDTGIGSLTAKKKKLIGVIFLKIVKRLKKDNTFPRSFEDQL